MIDIFQYIKKKPLTPFRQIMCNMHQKWFRFGYILFDTIRIIGTVILLLSVSLDTTEQLNNIVLQMYFEPMLQPNN